MTLVEWIVYGVIGICFILFICLFLSGTYIIKEINRMYDEEQKAERGLKD